MFERELTLYVFNRNYLRLLVADIDESLMNVAPFPGANPPVWILGHLAISTDYAAKILGQRRECPKEWHAMFGPGTNSGALEGPLPSKAELIEAFENGCRRVIEAMPNAKSEVLDAPHAIEILKSTVLKTNGDVLAHLMTTHESFHLAQLSACRRKTGKGPII